MESSEFGGNAELGLSARHNLELRTLNSELVLRQVGDELVDEAALLGGVDLLAEDLLGGADGQGGHLGAELGERLLLLALDVGRGPLALGGELVAEVRLGPLALAVGLHWALKESGWQPADAIAAALIAVPVVWAVLASAMLMQRSRRMQWLSLGLVAVVAVPALLAGG